MKHIRPTKGKTRAITPTGLILAHEVFCQEYIKDLNASKAYQTAYPLCKDTTAGTNGSLLLDNPKVIERLKQLLELRNKRVAITQDKVITELAKIAFADLTTYANLKSGRIKFTDFDKLTKEQTTALAEVGRTETGIKLKLHDKKEALELLGRHLGLWNDKLNLGGSLTVGPPNISVASPEGAEAIKKITNGN